MILSAESITDLIISRKLITNHAHDTRAQLQSASFDLRLSDKFSYPRPFVSAIYAVELKDYDKQINFESFVTDRLMLMPKTFVLASTIESVNLPNDLCASVEGRSSIGRAGLFIHNAGWIDPGFKGNITLELFNAAEYPLVLDAGRRICQIVFHKLDKPTFPYTGKYQNQVSVQGSKVNEDT